MKLEEWNYPLTEITEVLENKIDVVLVRFPMSHNCSEYEYRFCEVNN